MKRGFAVVIGVLGIAGAACVPDPNGTTTTTTTTPGGSNTAPAIASFAPTRASAPAPLTTAFRWTISDADGDPLTCSLDTNDNGVVDINIPNCTSSSIRSFTYAGSELGTITARLTVSDGQSSTAATTTVSVSSASSDQFDITLRLAAGMTATQQAAFTDAAARWSDIIRTGLAPVTVNLPADACGTGAPAFIGSIDDVMIDAAVTPIDGVGSILGSAGPCYTRSSNGLPVYGVMKFDSVDIASLEAGGQLDEVILHEMGHVLGIGTVWDSKVTGLGGSDPEYTGQIAVGTYQAIGGGSTVPVENTGGAGTRDGHWREATFDNELMTGWLDAGYNPLSKITIGALSDLGYGVTLNVADPYGVPLLRSSNAVEDHDEDFHLTTLKPIGSL